MQYTCYDASRNFIVCGATSGSIYLFQRHPCKFLQLIPDVFGPIVHVAISPEEHYVAYCSHKGTILVYVIDLDGNAQPTILSTYYREMTITQLKWRQNESQLFAGDMKGNVFLVNLNNFLVSRVNISVERSIDLNGFRCSFVQGRNLTNISIHPILFLESPVVQISDFDQLLLVSNCTKCILCNTETEEFKQIGNQPRDGKFGACFVSTAIDGSDNECEEVTTATAAGLARTIPTTRIFCARPGGRMWECDLDGSVIQTHKFKVALKSCHLAKILNPSTAPRAPNAQMIDQLVNLQPIRKRFVFGHTADAFFVFDVKESSAMLWNDEFGAIHTIKVIDDDKDGCTFVVFTKDNRTFTFQMLRLDQLFGDLVINHELYEKAAQLLLDHLSYFKRKIEDGKFVFSYSMLRNKLESIGPANTILSELQSNFDGLLNARAIQEQITDRRTVRMENGIYMIRDNGSMMAVAPSTASTTAEHYNNAQNFDEDMGDAMEPLVIPCRKPIPSNRRKIAPIQLSDDEKVLQNLFLIYKSLKWSNINLVERYADVFDRFDIPGIAKVLDKLEMVILENDPGVSEKEAKRNCARMFLSYFNEATALDELDETSFDFVIECFILVNASVQDEDKQSARCQNCKFPLLVDVAQVSLKYKSLGEKILEYLWAQNQRDRLAQIIMAIPSILIIKLKLMLRDKFESAATTAIATHLNGSDKETIADVVFACGEKRQLKQCVEKYVWFRSTEFWNKFIERLIRMRAQQLAKCTQCGHEQRFGSMRFIAEKPFYTYDYVFNVCADYLNGLTALQLCTKYSRHIPCNALGKSFYLKCLLHS